MFERFTDPARAAVVRAQERARALHATGVGSEHVLLGIADTGGPGGAALRSAGLDTPRLAELAASGSDDLDADALAALGIDLDAVRARADDVFGSGALDRAARGGTGRRGGHMPFRRDAKKSLELALREAIRLGDRRIDSGHLLLGVLRADCPGRHVLERAGADVDALRAETEAAITDAAA